MLISECANFPLELHHIGSAVGILHATCAINESVSKLLRRFLQLYRKVFHAVDRLHDVIDAFNPALLQAFHRAPVRDAALLGRLGRGLDVFLIGG